MRLRKCPACGKKVIEQAELERHTRRTPYICPSCGASVYLAPLLDAARYTFIHVTGLVGIALLIVGLWPYALALFVIVVVAATSLVRLWPLLKPK